MTPDSPATPDLRPTLGPQVCRWMESSLVHAHGDYLGQPFRLRRWQRAFLYQCYELEPDGRRAYDQVLLGLPKGDGKTELAAAVAVTELAGPVVFGGWDDRGRPLAATRLSPDIPVAAASFDQANKVFGAAGVMIEQGPLEDYFDVFDTSIVPRSGTGLLKRVAAVAGTNDGGLHSFVVDDELHEWTGLKERVHLVLSNSRAKRRDSWELWISTAGWDISSLFGRLYNRGRRGESPRLLFVWYTASDHWDLTDPEQLEAAIREANPAAGDFLPIENLINRYHDLMAEGKLHEFERYNLNRWTTAPERWIPVDAWEACAAERTVPDGTEVTLGFDGSWSGDSTALVGCTLDEKPHVFVLQVWEKPDQGGEHWRVDVLDVEEAIRDACRRFAVQAVACDPHRWGRSLQVLHEEGLPVVEWPTHSVARMVPACTQFEEAVHGNLLTHDGNERAAAHLGNCVVKHDNRGSRITKESKDSPRKIDITVAQVIAFDAAKRLELVDAGISFL